MIETYNIWTAEDFAKFSWSKSKYYKELVEFIDIEKQLETVKSRIEISKKENEIEPKKIEKLSKPKKVSLDKKQTKKGKEAPSFEKESEKIKSA